MSARLTLKRKGKYKFV